MDLLGVHIPPGYVTQLEPLEAKLQSEYVELNKNISVIHHRINFLNEYKAVIASATDQLPKVRRETYKHLYQMQDAAQKIAEATPRMQQALEQLCALRTEEERRIVNGIGNASQSNDAHKIFTQLEGRIRATIAIANTFYSKSARVYGEIDRELNKRGGYDPPKEFKPDE